MLQKSLPGPVEPDWKKRKLTSHRSITTAGERHVEGYGQKEGNQEEATEDPEGKARRKSGEEGLTTRGSTGVSSLLFMGIGSSLYRMRVLLVALLLQACVFVPRTVEVYDKGCQVSSRHMYIEPILIGDFIDCYDESCAQFLAALGAVAASSVVVSGSIVIVGNAVYWFEKQGRCVREF